MSIHKFCWRASRHFALRGTSRQKSDRCLFGYSCEPRQGAAAVELALVMPLLLAMSLGICELGQAFNVDAVLSEAARKGCATGTRPGCSNTDVIADAKAVLTASKFSASYATVTILVNGTAGEVAVATMNDKITVTVSMLVSQAIITNTFTFLTAGSSLSQTITMLKQG